MTGPRKGRGATFAGDLGRALRVSTRELEAADEEIVRRAIAAYRAEFGWRAVSVARGRSLVLRLDGRVFVELRDIDGVIARYEAVTAPGGELRFVEEPGR